MREKKKVFLPDKCHSITAKCTLHVQMKKKLILTYFFLISSWQHFTHSVHEHLQILKYTVRGKNVAIPKSSTVLTKYKWNSLKYHFFIHSLALLPSLDLFSDNYHAYVGALITAYEKSTTPTKNFEHPIYFNCDYNNNNKIKLHSSSGLLVCSNVESKFFVRNFCV